MGAIFSKNRQHQVHDDAEEDKGITQEEYEEYLNDIEEVKKEQYQGEQEPKVVYIGNREELVTNTITAKNINEPCLKSIFEGKSEDAINQIIELRNKQ